MSIYSLYDHVNLNFSLCVSTISGPDHIARRLSGNTQLGFFSAAVSVIPAVTQIFSLDRDGEPSTSAALQHPSLRPNLAEDRENMQKPTRCSLTLPCLIIQA